MRTDRDVMVQRWQKAMNRIGGPAALLGLPEQVKNVLKSTDDLTAKTRMLEAIADAMNRGRKAPEGGNMRQELEQRLYDLRYDMDCIADGGQELRQAISGLTDEELTEAIKYQEED